MNDATGEIRLISFNKNDDIYYDLFELNQIYFISNASIREANKTFNKTNNKYELKFSSNTVIQKSQEDDNKIPYIRYNFVPIENIMNMTNFKLVDILGIIKDIGEIKYSQTNPKLPARRLITIFYRSRYSINCCLWDKQVIIY